MNKKQLIREIIKKKSYLCIGLDTDVNLIPKHLLKYKNPIYLFNKEIIDATQDLCVAYKPNIAFYEQYGTKGWQQLEQTAKYIPDNIFSIADAKRGDIGNTSKMYAKAFFEQMNFDAITVAPYMGSDSILPFLTYQDKWTIILGLTSNVGSQDFQLLQSNKKPVYQHVIETCMHYGNDSNTMFVVGATQDKFMQHIRSFCPQHFLLVPGVGAQGGSLQDISVNGLNDEIGLLVNNTRGIIYASNGKDFAEKAREEAMKMQTEMKKLISKK